MADTADPGARSMADISTEHLVEFFDRQVEKLVEAGVPPDRLAHALKVAVVRAENLYAPVLRPADKVSAALDRLRAAAEANLPDSGYAGPERRRPGRPWSGK